MFPCFWIYSRPNLIIGVFQITFLIISIYKKFSFNFLSSICFKYLKMFVLFVNLFSWYVINSFFALYSQSLNPISSHIIVCFCFHTLPYSKKETLNIKYIFLSGCLLSQTDPPPHSHSPDFKNGNLTFVSATLGRTATFKCVAKNLVGQKTVSCSKNIFFSTMKCIYGI